MLYCTSIGSNMSFFDAKNALQFSESNYRLISPGGVQNPLNGKQILMQDEFSTPTSSV
jgi:hypothetical protein